MFSVPSALRNCRAVPPAFLFAIILLQSASSVDATEVTFRFRPPDGGSAVSVAGYFNEWNSEANPMADPEGDGVWEITLDIPPGKQQYKFVVNGAEWIADPFALEFSDDGFGGQNSLVDVGEESMTVGEPIGFVPGSEGESALSEPQGTEITFRYRPGEGAGAVSVAGSFNEWDAARHVMTDVDGDGVWEVTIPLLPGTYAYQFVVDGDDWHTDEFASEFEDDRFGGRNALLEVGTEARVIGIEWDAATPR